MTFKDQRSEAMLSSPDHRSTFEPLPKLEELYEQKLWYKYHTA
jgi:hypothetical protein